VAAPEMLQCSRAECGGPCEIRGGRKSKSTPRMAVKNT
jgi:hypothetical protein